MSTRNAETGTKSREGPGRDKGFVSLVGAGPGDPGLLTLKGRRRLQQADVVLYDRLVNPRLLDHAPPTAERVYVGKDPHGSTVGQEEVTALLLCKARTGQRVVRLKGGDPFVFGRGGEEASALAAAGIPFEIVPGISAAIAAPAYAGIPVTDRRYASSFTVVSGAHRQAGPRAHPDRHLSGDVGGVEAPETLVSLMSVNTLSQMVKELLDTGISPTVPAAIVESATTPRQRTITASLGGIVARALEAGVRSPATLVVGPTVQLADSLAWFESGPLFGRRIGVVGAPSEMEPLACMLEDLGADVVWVPSVLYTDPEDWSSLDQALRSLDSYEWAAFDSPQAVHASLDRLRLLGRDMRAWSGTKVASLCPAAAEALRERGLLPDASLSPLEPADPGGATFWDGAARGRLLLMSSKSLVSIPYARLIPSTVQVDVALAYRHEPPPSLAQHIINAIEAGLDALCFTSRFAVENAAVSLGAQSGLLRSVPAVCGDPSTAAVAQIAGCRPVSIGRSWAPVDLTQAVIATCAAQAQAVGATT